MSEQSVATSLREPILHRYRRVRSETQALASPITPEDAQVQSMDDVSPAKWHLGHTSWFFETFVLRTDPSYRSPREEFKVLFNSYYNAVGEKHPRPKRGMLTRPALEEILDYRQEVDVRVGRLLETATDAEIETIAPIVRVGLHHEQQHQELMLTDILHVHWSNPLRPAYWEQTLRLAKPPLPLEWHRYSEGVYRIGFEGEGFSFDNEHPRHRQFVHAFELGSRLTTAGEYMEFIADGGYERPELWLSDGWAKVNGDDTWQAPLYWDRRQGTWWRMTLCGMQPVDPNAPVCHLSYYEADAYSRWRGARLPTEAEWEVAAAGLPIEGNLQGSDFLTPMSPFTGDPGKPRQMYGDVWEWTGSAYLPYPGYRISDGALGEYNGKFMCNQMVLRGGSFVTHENHIRPSYRNFFYPDARWQFTGIRLARDVR